MPAASWTASREWECWKTGKDETANGNQANRNTIRPSLSAPPSPPSSSYPSSPGRQCWWPTRPTWWEAELSPLLRASSLLKGSFSSSSYYHIIISSYYQIIIIIIIIILPGILWYTLKQALALASTWINLWWLSWWYGDHVMTTMMMMMMILICRWR